MRLYVGSLVLCAATLAACSDETVAPACGDCDGTQVYAASQDWTRDILHTALDVSLAGLTARAQIELAGSDSSAASFEAQGLAISAVTDASGEPLEHVHVDGRLDVGVPPSDAPQSIVVDYTFGLQSSFDGLLDQGSTLLWPYFCGNLFPCKSSPQDGLTFELSVRDGPEGTTTVFPARIETDAPSYMIAWATADYTELELGVTPAGTKLSAWHYPGGEESALAGNAHLVDAFAYFEQTLGPYTFGDHAGAIAVRWGPGALGGMEHHPYWHTAEGVMDDEDTQIHEAAHGWYGDGIRITCWEDFVLSEGTVSYLAARAIEEVIDQATADALWSNYAARLNAAMGTSSLKIAWPEGCGQIDLLEDKLFSSIPCMKGAMFFRALERRIGVPALMGALSTFYLERVGGSARMQELLDHIALETGYDAAPCAEAWLRNEAVPELPICP